jgi:hypothetical protein
VTLQLAAGVGVEQIRRLSARTTEMTSHDETSLFGTRRLFAQPNLENTAWNLRGRLSATDGEYVFKALEDTADRLVAGDDVYRPTLPQRRADALVAWAMDSLDPTGADGPSVSTRLAATVHIDATTATRTEGSRGGDPPRRQGGFEHAGGDSVWRHRLDAHRRRWRCEDGRRHFANDPAEGP